MSAPTSTLPATTTLARALPVLIIAAAVVHLAAAVFLPGRWAQIASDGFAGARRHHHSAADFERLADWWYLATGIALLGIGTLARHIVAATGRLPAQVGGYLLALGIPLLIMMPVSGAPVLVILGALASWDARPTIR